MAVRRRTRHHRTTLTGPEWLEQSYDEFPRIEEEFKTVLDESLSPRGPDFLYELVERFRLPRGSRAIDVGCGEGKHSVRLAEGFGFDVVGIDPVPRHLELAQVRSGDLRFELGSAEALPVEDGSFDLVWCRDVLVHVRDLRQAYSEFHRVLRPGGRALVYQMFGTERLEPREAGWFWPTMGVVPASADPASTAKAIAASGLRLDECIVLGSEWGELAQEQSGDGGRRLLHAARLLRDPDRYVARFGRTAFEIMLGDCLWHVYAMIGKLERRVYLLTRP
jgi:SAM-dependent methyltransferase